MTKISIATLACLCMVVFLVGCGATSDFISKNDLDDMPIEEIEQAFKDVPRDVILNAWGKPDGYLSGLFGDIYKLKDDSCFVIMYGEYKADHAEVMVESVSFMEPHSQD